MESVYGIKNHACAGVWPRCSPFINKLTPQKFLFMKVKLENLITGSHFRIFVSLSVKILSPKLKQFQIFFWIVFLQFFEPSSFTSGCCGMARLNYSIKIYYITVGECICFLCPSWEGSQNEGVSVANEREILCIKPYLFTAQTRFIYKFIFWISFLH